MNLTFIRVAALPGRLLPGHAAVPGGLPRKLCMPPGTGGGVRRLFACDEGAQGCALCKDMRELGIDLGRHD